MEECCVVCAEPLEWVGYGVCGHRDVCSRCIARLRFVLGDKRCCICKQECSCVFVTRALGNYTKVIKDFGILHKTGDFWYEKNTEAFFDDKDHFTMVKDMCRLSCQLCEQAESPELNIRKGYVFKSLDQLQRHSLSTHKVQMCNLCLESRKIFICEQKLYNKVQLERHLANGDAEIDGIGEERGGFTGHPLCNFCQKRYYSDNELYHHMSVDHYLCHICQRMHPGQYDYFHNYDDLEVHFRHEHSLCEHSDCLAKKFVVFVSDAELKKHNALTHGGNMSRSQRNVYLQIPVSFQYRRPPTFRHGSSLNARNQTNGQELGREPGSLMPFSETGGSLAPHLGTGLNDREANVADSPGLTDISRMHESFGYLTVAGGSKPPGLEGSAFPPLPGSKRVKRKLKQGTHGSSSSGSRAFQGTVRTSSLSPLHGRAEDSPCSSRARTVASLNEQFQDSDREACSGKGMVNAMNPVNIGNTVSLINQEVHDTEPPLINGLECGFQLTDEIRSANKALGEKIRSRLGDDVDLFRAFKDLSAQFRKGELDAIVYCKHIRALGLSELVPELARLCPEPEKQRALLNAFKVDLKGKQPMDITEARLGKSTLSDRKEGATKVEANGKASVHSTVSSVATLRLMDRGGTQANNGEAQIRNGYCEPKGRNKAASSFSRSSSGSSSIYPKNEAEVLLLNVKGHADVPHQMVVPHVTNTWSCIVCTLENSGLKNRCAACEMSRPTAVAQCDKKRQKKVSKFERLRLDKESPSSPAVQLPESAQKKRGGGVWKNGGGQKLVALAQREAVINSAWSKQA